MRKSQVSIFMILGFAFIVIIIISLVGVYLNQLDPANFYKKKIQTDFDSQSLKAFVEEYCMAKEIPAIARELAKNGGTLFPIKKVEYKGNNYRILCQYLEGSKYCINRIPTLHETELEMADAIKERIEECMDFSYFEELGYVISAKALSPTIEIGNEFIAVYLSYPIEMSKGELSLTMDQFYTQIPSSYGLAYKLSVDIINQEASEAFFDKDEWMRNQNTIFRITKNRPYPFAVYSLEAENLTFWFAVEQENKASRAGRNYAYDLEYGCCFADNECFKNTDEATCKEKLGTYQPSSSCTCNQHFLKTNTIIPLRSCGSSTSGEAWCMNEQGIGGRSLLYSCHDGKIFTEDCADYHEQVCVEYSEGIKKAICKPNRWEDCQKCSTKECCENDFMRDCLWDEKSFGTRTSGNSFCIPKIAPGFSQGNGQEVCNRGARWETCQGISCPKEWVQYASDYCAMMGDCGLNANYRESITTSGFIETAPTSFAAYKIKDKPFMSLNRMSSALSAQSGSEFFEIITSFISAWMRFIDESAKKKPEVMNFAFCTLWQPPLTGNCKSCNNEEYCSEYKCTSIAEQCVFKIEDGYPICEEKQLSSKNLTISLESNSTIVYSAIELAGKRLFGYEIVEPVLPFTDISLVLNTSQATKCKLTYMPELKFTQTPAIWFGKPTYEHTHNISFLLPRKIKVPSKIYSSLNISTLAELYSLIIQKDQSLLKAFDQVLVDLTDRGSNYLIEREYMLELLKLTISGLDNNTYYLFVRCMDESGNENQEPVYLKFQIEQQDDANPPNLMASLPANNSQLSSSNYTLKMFMNEPVECRFSENSEPYSLMEYNMECETSIMRINERGRYVCQATTEILTPHISCLDNPPQILKLKYNITEEINISPTEYTIEGRNVIADSSIDKLHLSDREILYNVTFAFNEAFECNIGFEDSPSAMEPMTCYEGYCSKELLAGNYSLYLFCHIESSAQRNENSFFLNFTIGDLKIISVFPEVDATLVSKEAEIAVIVNKNSAEHLVSCSYSTDEIQFYQMNLVGTYQFKSKIQVEEGQTNVAFRCVDKSGVTTNSETFFRSGMT